MGHPLFDASWEGLCIENICAALPHWRPGFYRTSDGAEIDLVMEKGGRRQAFECKASLSPKTTRAFRNAVVDVGAECTWIVYPGTETYPAAPDMHVIGLPPLLDKLRDCTH